ncbi:MAG: VOC family protein [Candidatus Pelethousia sp.]|nr:VOC family protein [Candidatus Pelethousia sp.]
MAMENSVIFLPCSNIKKTTTFYREIVGLPLVQEQSGGICKIFDTGYGYLGFCQYDDGRPTLGGPTGVCISLNCHDVADVDKHYREIAEKGAIIVSTPKNQERFPVYAFFMHDPDQYKVEFQYILLPEQQLMGGRK